MSASQYGQIEGVVLRLSNAFGVPAHKDANCWMLLVNDLCRQAVQTRQMVLHSSGLQQRDFIPLEDVGRAVSHLLELSKEQCNGLFNLGSGVSLSIFELTQRIAARCQIILGFRPEIVRPEPALDEQTVSLRYECNRLYRTGFRLKGSVEQEIDNTLVLCAQVWG
jgi:UDP-glucose 4-epimerase